jgi:hypothetical protein
MSIAPESLAASRFRELRKLDEKVQKLGRDLAEAREVVDVLTTEKAAAAQRDKQAYASALSEGKARPSSARRRGSLPSSRTRSFEPKL